MVVDWSGFGSLQKQEAAINNSLEAVEVRGRANESDEGKTEKAVLKTHLREN